MATGLLLPTAFRFKEMKIQFEKLQVSFCRVIWCAVRRFLLLWDVKFLCIVNLAIFSIYFNKLVGCVDLSVGIFEKGSYDSIVEECGVLAGLNVGATLGILCSLIHSPFYFLLYKDSL